MVNERHLQESADWFGDLRTKAAMISSEEEWSEAHEELEDDRAVLSTHTDRIKSAARILDLDKEYMDELRDEHNTLNSCLRTIENGHFDDNTIEKLRYVARQLQDKAVGVLEDI